MPCVLVDPFVVQRARGVVVPRIVGVRPAVRVTHAGITVHSEHELEPVGAARCPAVALALLTGRCESPVADPCRPGPEDDVTMSTRHVVRREVKLSRSVDTCGLGGIRLL